MKRFTIADLDRKYGVKRALVSSLVRAGFVLPTLGKRREYLFSFNDVVVLRKAQEWRQVGIPAKKIVAFLKELAGETVEMSPASFPVLTRGNDLVVRERGLLRNSDGQFVLDLEDARASAAVSVIREVVSVPNLNVSAAGWHAAAVILEEKSPLRAIEYYQKAIEIDQKFSDAYINLSCLLIEAGQHIEAFAVCQEGLTHCPEVPLLYFNLGVLYEEMNSVTNAILSYSAALMSDPDFSDAHFNLARLYEAEGEKRKAIRHYARYHRLSSDQRRT